MIIRYAEEKNFIELRQFYDGMCKVLSGKDFLPEGDKGGFPPDEMIKDAIKERNQFIGIEDGRIVAAYIMNHDRDEAYHAVKWLIDANDNETVVLHALRVLPEYGGRGYSKQLVQHAIDTARERNLKSIRLDCIEEMIFHRKCICRLDLSMWIKLKSHMLILEYRGSSSYMSLYSNQDIITVIS